MSRMKTGLELVQERMRQRQEGGNEVEDVMSRIEELCGSGDRADLRSMWYSRLEAQLMKCGDPKCMIIVERALKRAADARNPGRYFVKVVTGSFEQHGWW